MILKMKKKDFVFINVGTLLFAVGIVFFRNPNQFAAGGLSGVSLLISHFIPNVSPGTIMIILNTFVLGLGYIILGKESAAKSAYGTFALSAMIWILEFFFPLSGTLTDQKFLELVYSVFIPGIGGAMVFYYGATLGGTDIIAQILSKYFKLKITISLLFADFFIALSAGLIFGAEACLYSVLAVCLRTFLMDNILDSLKIYKIVVIISDEYDEIKNFIREKLNRSATIHMAYGAYSFTERRVITSVMTRRQALLLQQYIKTTDPKAFITISNSTEIIGNGFGGFN